MRADTTGLHRLPHAERALSEAAAGIKHTTQHNTQNTQHTDTQQAAAGTSNTQQAAAGAALITCTNAPMTAQWA